MQPMRHAFLFFIYLRVYVHHCSLSSSIPARMFALFLRLRLSRIRLDLLDPPVKDDVFTLDGHIAGARAITEFSAHFAVRLCTSDIPHQTQVISTAMGSAAPSENKRARLSRLTAFNAFFCAPCTQEYLILTCHQAHRFRAGTSRMARLIMATGG